MAIQPAETAVNSKISGSQLNATATDRLSRGRSMSEKNEVQFDEVSRVLEDSFDPQNWPPRKKALLFLALMSSSILCDGGMTWGVSLFVDQTFEWDISMAKSSTSINYGILMQGIGGVIAVPFIESYGRYPTWFWSQFITLGMVTGATLAPSFNSYVAFRSLQGLFGTVPQVIGLPIIHDMYGREYWARMINIWDTTFLVGPYLGPGISGYLTNAMGWRGVSAVLVALYAVSTILVLLFGRETYYNPNAGLTRSPGLVESITARGGGIALQRASLAPTARELVIYIFKVPMLLVGIAAMVNSTWPIGITVTVDSFIRAPPYLMNNTAAASMRWAAVLGDLAGWLIGYFFHEWVNRTKMHKPGFRSETRLHGVWIPLCCLVGGLLTYGLTINAGKHWIGIAFGWFGVNIGLVGVMVAITAFALEKYPERATIVSSIINMWRTSGGFSVSYFQTPWVKKDGVAVVFGLQATLAAVIVTTLITAAILLGRKSSRGGLV